MTNTTISLLNSHVYVFIVVTIVVLIIVSVYNMIAPEESVPFNFNPFPKIAPTELPDPYRSSERDSCFNKLTPCDDFGNCSACDASEYKCQAVSDQDAKNKRYHFNGINVPQGNWCIPKDNNPNPQCNTFTGRWIWTFDQEYCNSVNAGKSQCWKCECIYPSLYGGSDCGEKVACQNTSTRSNTTSQPANKLVSDVAYFKNPVTWDPLAPTQTDVMRFTPFDQDQNGESWFKCDCQDTSGGQYFSRLPGDPMTCHLNPCSVTSNYEQGNNIEISGGQTVCNCNSTNLVKAPMGTYQNTCVSLEGSCGSEGASAGWDASRESCLCGDGPFWEQKCKNPVYNIRSSEEVPTCSSATNFLGSECVNPCSKIQCQNGAVCTSCGPNSNKTLPSCNFYTDPEGKQLKNCPSTSSQGGQHCSPRSDGSPSCSDWLAENPEEIHGVCDCSSITQSPGGNYGGYFGPTCAFECLKSGVDLYRTDNWMDVCGGGGSASDKQQNCNCCCSLAIDTSSESWKGELTESCAVEKPDMPDPNCLPICTTCKNVSC